MKIMKKHYEFIKQMNPHVHHIFSFQFVPKFFFGGKFF